MPSSMVEIINASLIRKDRPSPRSSVEGSKPFVVTGALTKRYAPAKKPPVQRQPPIAPPTPTKERLSLPRWMTSTRDPVSKVGSRRCSFQPIPRTASTKVEKSAPMHAKASTHLEKKRVAANLSKVDTIGGRLRQGSATQRSAPATATNELPPRPSCVPSYYRSSVGAINAAEGENSALAKVSSAVPAARQKPSVTISAGVKDMPSDRRIVAPTRKRSTIVYQLPVIGPDWSPPPSPDLSSFPSQSWTIVTSVGVQQIETPSATTICSSESVSSTEAPKPPWFSPILPTSERHAKPTIAIDGVIPWKNCSPMKEQSTVASHARISSGVHTSGRSPEPTVVTAGMKIPTEEPSTEMSHAICIGATITSPSRSSTDASIAALARVMTKSRASLSSEPPDDGSSRSRMMVHRAVEFARTLFSPPESRVSVAAPRTMGANVSRLRKLFVPPLDKNAKASTNPITQMEVDMLRVQKKVAGGGVVDLRLERLGSLAAMAIATKLGVSGPNSSCRGTEMERER